MFSPDAEEKRVLKELQINKLYVKFFDVDWDEIRNTAIPVAEIKFEQKPDTSYKIIPVIFITNRTLLKSKGNDISLLAGHIYDKTQWIAKNNGIQYKELQMDCDWTDGSREKYFELINLIKEKLKTEHNLISATIRLHQVKYSYRTGVPPVDRGMLMFYNMGKMKSGSVSNSIYNDYDAEKYVQSVKKYPLLLDVALPIFSWAIHMRYNRIIELLNKVEMQIFDDKSRFTKQADNSYVANNSFFLHGTYIMKNDIFRIEETNPEICKNAANKVANELKTCNRSIILFDLNPQNISKYENKDFEEIFNSFN